MDMTAKVVCWNKSEPDSGQVNISFKADYADGRNKEWAKYTPNLALSMTVTEEVAANFEKDVAYLLVLTPE